MNPWPITLPDGTPLPGRDDLGSCAYAQGVGSCSFGCWEEPSCHTDCPSEGWAPLGLHPVHAQNLRARQLAHRVSNWLGWLPFRGYKRGIRHTESTLVGRKPRVYPTKWDVLWAMNSPGDTPPREAVGSQS